MAYVGHVLIGFSGSNAVLRLEVKFEAKKVTGRLRRTWIDDNLLQRTQLS